MTAYQFEGLTTSGNQLILKGALIHRRGNLSQTLLNDTI